MRNTAARLTVCIRLTVTCGLLMIALAVPAVASALQPPQTTSDAKASYPASPAVIRLTAPFGSVAVCYRLDGGPTQQVTASASPTGSVDPTKTSEPPQPPPKSPLPNAPAIPPYAKSKSLILASHLGGPDTGVDFCSVCHRIADPPSITEWQVAQGIYAIPDAYKPHATQHCRNCHNAVWYSPAMPSAPTTDVVVSGIGLHTLEFWAVDAAGNEEPHHTVTFLVGVDPMPPMIQTIGIRASATTFPLGRELILSGAVTPTRMVGKTVSVWVKKPGKTYWTYSSNRTVYAKGSGAAWWYRFKTKRGMARGTYSFKCTFAGDAQMPVRSSSKTIIVKVR